jgi:DNA replication and repair protein RecF
VLVRRLSLTDFRSYRDAQVDLAPGLTAVLGDNGEGKTNLLEALGYIATLGSFRGAPTDALIRAGSGAAIVRAEGERGGRDVLVEAEIVAGGRNRVQVNKQRLPRARDLLGALRVSVFSPDDLELVKGGPTDRRRYLDDTLVSLHPRHDATRAEVERVLRQRNALLRQVSGRLDDSAALTLDVWDSKLIGAGEALADARDDLIGRLRPAVGAAYRELAGAARAPDVELAYDAPWRVNGLAAALAAARRDELRRGVSLVGPHRDELVLTIGGLPARTHASQGEQRSLSLALRLGAHAVVTEATGEPPVLLLDDVFSELDGERSHALLAHLPPGQAVLTSAVGLPAGAVPDQVLRVKAGVVVEET